MIRERSTKCYFLMASERDGCPTINNDNVHSYYLLGTNYVPGIELNFLHYLI